MRRVLLLGALSVVVLVASLSAFFLTRPPADDFPADAAGPEVIVAVDDGETLAEIGAMLVEQRVIKTIEAFLRAIEANPDAKLIQPGGHRVETNLPASLAIEQMLDRDRRVGVLTFFEGIRLAQVVQRLTEFGLTPSDLRAALASVEAPYPKATSLEGFLLPGQYAFVPDISAVEALAAMVERFERTADRLPLAEASDALGVSPYQAVIIASLLQAEGHPEDYSKILRVILNRLKIGMALQLDATVLYALNRFGDVRVTSRDLQVDSPYNTYRYRGLPPGPINNPGAAALEALASPAEGDWLYYITVKPGDTRFTRSHDEFLRWKVEFRRNYANGLFE